MSPTAVSTPRLTLEMGRSRRTGERIALGVCDVCDSYTTRVHRGPIPAALALLAHYRREHGLGVRIAR